MEKAEGIERVTERTMTRALLGSAIVILLCLICLSGTTWAWYSATVISGAGEITIANYDINVTAEGEGITNDGNGNRVFTNGGTVTLTPMDGTEGTGFCRIVATKDGEDSGTVYYCDKLTETVSLTVTGAGTLKITPMLGKMPEDVTVLDNGDEILLKPVPAPAKFEQEETESKEDEPDDEDDPIDDEPAPGDAEQDNPEGGTKEPQPEEPKTEPQTQEEPPAE